VDIYDNDHQDTGKFIFRRNSIYLIVDIFYFLERDKKNDLIFAVLFLFSLLLIPFIYVLLFSVVAAYVHP